MARLTKITRSNPISRFRQEGPEAGVGLSVISAGLEALYSRLGPAAVEEMKRRGQQLGMEQAGITTGDLDITYPEVGKAALDGAVDSKSQRNAAMAAHGGPTKAAAAAMNGDRELLAKTLAAEAGGEGLQGMVAAGAVIANRAKVGGYGDSINDVIMKPGQFSAWNKVTGYAGGKGGLNMDRIKPSSEAYRAADMILAGEYEDPTGGATHYYNDKVADPKWGTRAGGDWKRIGNHIFGNADAGRGGPARVTDGGTVSTQGSTPQETPQPQITLRNAKGELESRLYSPFSGPILQAHNLAATSAYQSKVVNDGTNALIEIGMQFEFDPEGYQQAAQEYVDQIVDAAPDMLKPVLRGSLEKEASRRTLGIQESRHRDIRKRANNSNKALVDRYSDDYANALANGDAGQIAEARAVLDDALRNRELLPGVGWTLEQSGNIILGAQRRADRVRESRAKEYRKEVSDTFDLITKTAGKGATAAGEEILTDPNAIAADPEGAREAAAFVALRDGMPEFLQMTPDEMFASVAAMETQEITEEWQLDIREAARKMAVENRNAWEDDPVKRAGEVLPQEPPDISAAVETGDPAEMASAFGARREYMDRVVESGYTDTRAFLTEEEAEQMQTVMSKETDPVLRAAMAGAITQGFGQDAVRVFDEIDGDDLTMYAGKIMASGGAPALAGEILRGQMIMDEGVVKIPTDATVRDTFNSNFGPAFSGLYRSAEAQSDVMKAARAIYAARAGGVVLDDAGAETLLGESINAALGARKNKRGQMMGGVQDIMGQPTLLPLDITAEAVDRAFMAILGPSYGAGGSRTGLTMPESTAGNLEPFEAASDQGIPYFGDEPLSRDHMKYLSLKATGPEGYRIEATIGGSVSDITDANGAVFAFDLGTLIEATR